MRDIFEYEFLFDQAFLKIKSVRNPTSERPEVVDLGWDIVSRQQLFDFAGNDFFKIKKVTEYAHDVSISCLRAIFIKLFQHYELNVYPIEIKFKISKQSPVIFAFVDDKNKILLLFKEIEPCSFWKIKNHESEDIIEVMELYGVNKCAYVYLVNDYAYMQVIGHNDDEADPGRGYNLFSIRWLYEKYFGVEEYNRFNIAIKKYIDDVNRYIGYIYVKSLTSNASVSFRKIVGKEIRNWDYSHLLNVKVHEFELDLEGFQSIQDQFIKQERYKLLVGKDDFAESFITAEWLYDSLKKAYAIDLTIVGMGYFKSIEQLLYRLICLHKNEKRMMRKDFSYKGLPSFIELNDANIENNYLDTTIGSMANFYKDNLDMLRNNLKFKTKKYIREFIFLFKDLRNGYFHKHNIHDWSIIDEIRSKTYYLIFLLLGAQNLSENDLAMLGGDDRFEDDYYKLCEYMNYHSGDIFYFNLDKNREFIFTACSDPHIKIEKNHMVYSGIYIKEIYPNGQRFKVGKEQLPLEIYLGTLGIEQSEKIKFNPHKVKVIYQDGKFVGPLIEDENIMEY